MRIGTKNIGADESVYVIAEVGFNHGGSVELALEMIKAAAETGADAVKFQSYRTENLVLPHSSHYEVIKSGELNLTEHRILKKTAEECGISFISTPFCEESVDLLEELGLI